MYDLLKIVVLLSTSVSKDTREYEICIEAIPCPHDGEDLKKLHKPEYMKTMKCRVERHMQCIKTEIEREHEGREYFKY